MTSYFLISPSGDAYENLARDELLLRRLAPDSVALYLYVNARAVIIGRNQNPYIECDLSKLDADNVQLVRRLSGGGAVYHDGGNLNYSFLAPEGLYDQQRQTGVILEALKEFGIAAEVSGRNDLTANGFKFSGTAFCQLGANRLQHGTLLIDSDLSALPKYLTPSPLKLQAKGIKSVRARVCNLREMSAHISVSAMQAALRRAFEKEYGAPEPYLMDESFFSDLEALKQQRMARKWRIGESPRYDVELETRLSAGLFRLCLNVAGGVISDCRVFSDCLDETLPGQLAQCLKGTSFEKGAFKKALEPMGEVANELIGWLDTVTI